MNQDRSTYSLQSLTSRHGTLLIVLLIAQVVLFYPTYWSMVEIWWRSETFAHGFFIFPISAYLVWTKRREFSQVNFTSDLRASIFLFGLGFLWLVANLVDVTVVQQFAVVGMIPILVWLVLGFKAVWVIAFPLAFMLFAVPFGEFLIAPMMEFTAIFTVNAIRMSGIPVFWEGLFFTLPTGSWSVVEACSGVRYIIASLTLGCLYAYLTFNSLWKRGAFILFSILVPIIANGIRAYMIVMIGHLSDMTLATGVDHLIYGWVWFGIVMFFMFWIGSFWREDDQPSADADQNDPRQISPSKTPVAATIVGVLLLAVWPAWSSFAQQNDSQPFAGTFDLTLDKSQWQISEQTLTDWVPHFVDPTYQVNKSLSNGEARIGFYLAYYGAQAGTGELISSQNVMLNSKDKVWRQLAQSKKPLSISGDTFDVVETHLNSRQGNLLVWHWNRINGFYSSNDYYSKVLEALARLTGKPKEGMALVFYATYLEDQNLARERLNQFLADMLPDIEVQLEKLSSQSY